MGLGCSCLKPALPVVPTVDVSRMLGEWRVIAVLPTPLEKGAFNPTEMYTWDESKQRIDVGFTFNKGSLDGPVKSLPQKLYTGGYPESTGKWKASPIWPLKLDYIIMDLAEDYSYVVVGHPSRSYFWLMAHDATSLPQDVVDAALDLAAKNGFNVANVEYPQHSPAEAPLVPKEE